MWVYYFLGWDKPGRGNPYFSSGWGQFRFGMIGLEVNRLVPIIPEAKLVEMMSYS